MPRQPRRWRSWAQPRPPAVRRASSGGAARLRPDRGERHGRPAICRRLDGLPLAIELAAARQAFPAPTLLHHLERPLPLLTGGPRDQPTRLQALRDAIGWSYDLLTADEQAFFQRLSVLAGGGLEAIAAIRIRSRRDRSRRPGRGPRAGRAEPADPDRGAAGEPRYGMLETIREFGLERLEASGESATRAAHAAYYLALAEQAEPHLIASGSAAWVERLAIERRQPAHGRQLGLAHRQRRRGAAGRDDPLLRLRPR